MAELIERRTHKQMIRVRIPEVSESERCWITVSENYVVGKKMEDNARQNKNSACRRLKKMGGKKMVDGGK